MYGSFENAAKLLFQQRTQLFAAGDGLLAGAFAESRNDLRGGLHADVAHDERGFEFFESGLVDFAGQGDDVVDAGGEVLAGAGDRFAHAREEARFPSRFFLAGLGFLFFLFIFWLFVVAGK